MNNKIKKVDIVVSCYNEEKNIIAFFNEIKKYLTNKKYIYNIVFVNDGSVDNTLKEILKAKKKETSKMKVSYISFIHNFGHEAAMCAGIDNSKADYIIVMDVDLQNPPKKIPEILEKFEEGADCVLLRRIKYKNASILKIITSRGYNLFSRYILQNNNAYGVSDFFAINKNLAKIIKAKYKTTLRFVRSFIQKEAKNIKFVNYENAARHAGVSRYDYIKLTKLAIVSELSRIKWLRDKYKISKDNKVYIIDKKRTKLN